HYPARRLTRTLTSGPGRLPMYAIIEDSGTQIKVSEGDVIDVDKRELAEDQATLTFDRVLMIGGEGDATVGQPTVEGATVEGDILLEDRTDKVRIVKFKRRKNYHRTKGHRQPFVRVKITRISA
ncbi:MAG: 50S ribosomal protein L21, partial [Phycisphaerae bacterium]